MVFEQPRVGQLPQLSAWTSHHLSDFSLFWRSKWETTTLKHWGSSLFNQQIHLLRDSPFIFWDLKHVKCPKFTQVCESVIRQHPTQKTHTIHTIIGVYHYTYHHSHMAFFLGNTKPSKTPSFGYPTINHPPRCHAEPRSVAVDLEIHLHLLEATNHPIPLCQSQSYSLLHSCHFQRCSPKHPAPQEDTPWMLSSWETCQHCQRKLVEKVREFGSQGVEAPKQGAFYR